MYLLWLIPEFYIRRGEDSLALQSRERRGGKKKRRAERNSQANRGRQQSGENKRQRHSTGSLMKGLRQAHRFGRTNRTRVHFCKHLYQKWSVLHNGVFSFHFFFLLLGPLCVATQNSAPDPFVFFISLFFLVLIRRSTVTQRAQRHGLINT